MTWCTARFGDIVELIRRPVDVEPDGIYPELGIRSFGRGTFHKPAVSGDQITRDLFQICDGDLLINLTFAWEGAVAIAQAEDDGRYASHRFYSFKTTSDQILLPFLRAYFTTPTGLRRLQAISPGGAGRNRVLSLRKLLDETVPLPPLNEQRRIVLRMDRATAAIDARKRVSAYVDTEVDATLAAAFARIVADAPRRPMAQVAPLVRRGVTIDSQASYTEIGLRSFHRGIFARRTMIGEEFSWQKLFWIAEKDLIFSNLMAWEKAVALADAEHAGSVGNHRMLTCEVDQSICLPEFLYYHFKTDEGHKQILAASPGTMVRNKTLSNKLLPKIEVPVPSLDAQHWFDSLQAKARSARLAQAEAATELAGLLPAMLHEAFGDDTRTI